MHISEGNAGERFHPTIQNHHGTDGVGRTAARLAELEECIERGLQTFVEVGRALLEIRDRRLYRERGFQTFEDYCLHRWGWKRAHAYRHIEAARVVENLSPIGDIPRNEAQARELAKLEPDEQREVAEAVHSAGESFDSVTAAEVRDIARQVKSGASGRLDVHFSHGSDEWYTPREMVERVTNTLGAIDLDPCSNSHVEPAVPAALHYTQSEDGLAQPWHGRVFINPPYGRVVFAWIQKLIAEYSEGRVSQAIALVPSRTDTEWFGRLWDYTICFVDGRLKFSGYDNSAPFPSAVVYLGPNVDGFHRAFATLGAICVRRQAAEGATR